MRAAPWIAVAAVLVVIAVVVFWLAPAMDRAAVPAAAPSADVRAATGPAAQGPGVPLDAEPEARAAAAVPDEPAVEHGSAAVGTEVVTGRLFLADGPPGEAVELRLGSGDDEGTWKLLEQATSGTDGTFRFEGVPAGWRGDVLLPQHYRLVRPSTRLWRDRAFPVGAGEHDLAIEVVRLPSVRGRVLAVGGTPAAEQSLVVELFGESGSSIRTAYTGDDGRFVLALPRDPPHRLVVACRTDDAQSLRREWTEASLPPPDSRGDIHVGDLQLALGATARVLVLGPEGAPFQGASVMETGASGGRTFTTGEDGAVLVQLVDGVEGLEVLADGCSLVELPRPAPGEEVVVHLRPAARLRVDVVDASGQPWPQGRLRLKAAKPPFEGDREGQASSPKGAGAAWCNETGVDREGYYTVCRTDERGRIEWERLAPGRQLEITLEDALGTPGAHASVPGLAAGEQRSVLLELAREPLRVGGRCVDAAGAGIAGARIEISMPGTGSADVVSDATGAFEGPPLLVERVRLRASAAGFADASVDDVALPAEPTLVLQRGRTLGVHLRDAGGAPFDVGFVQARAGATTWNGGTPDAGRCDLVDVPDVGLELEHAWQKVTHTLAVPDGATELDWELPALGRLEVEVGACAFGEHESAHLLLEALDGRGVVQQELLASGEAGAFRFSPWPGRYALRRVVHAFTVDADGWRTPAGSRDLGLPVEVEVAADRIAHATLESAP